MRSMTGYGQASGAGERLEVTVTLRGVNHRFLDVNVRLDEELREREKAVRDLLSAELHRGRVDASVEVRSLAEREAEVEVHRGIVGAAHHAFHELVVEGLISRELTAGEILGLPEAVSVRVLPARWEEEDSALLESTVREALAQLVAAREREGEALAEVIGARLDALGEVVEELSRRAAGQSEETARQLEERLERLLVERTERAATLDPSRLAQEVAILAEKSDVTEELDRLRSHLVHAGEVVASPGAVGKRLDFLIQEILRELNTLGSKCRNAGMTRSLLDAKELTEQLREQMQNVE